MRGDCGVLVDCFAFQQAKTYHNNKTILINRNTNKKEKRKKRKGEARWMPTSICTAYPVTAAVCGSAELPSPMGKAGQGPWLPSASCRWECEAAGRGCLSITPSHDDDLEELYLIITSLPWLWRAEIPCNAHAERGGGIGTPNPMLWLLTPAEDTSSWSKLPRAEGLEVKERSWHQAHCSAGWKVLEIQKCHSMFLRAKLARFSPFGCSCPSQRSTAHISAELFRKMFPEGVCKGWSATGQSYCWGTKSCRLATFLPAPGMSEERRRERRQVHTKLLRPVSERKWGKEAKGRRDAEAPNMADLQPLCCVGSALTCDPRQGTGLWLVWGLSCLLPNCCEVTASLWPETRLKSHPGAARCKRVWTGTVVKCLYCC